MTKRELIWVIITILVMCVPVSILAYQNKQLKSDLPSAVFDWNEIKATPTKTGEKRQFFDSPTATLDNLECHVSTLNPGETAHPPHQHPEEELTIVKEGTIEVLVNGELKRAGAGSIIFAAANKLHNIKNVGTTPATYYAIKWKSAKTVNAVKTN
ncbi:MAG: cupin domain-containing protein [Janthinobacterium lividum]